jgi:hypothetical protein
MRFTKAPVVTKLLATGAPMLSPKTFASALFSALLVVASSVCAFAAEPPRDFPAFAVPPSDFLNRSDFLQKVIMLTCPGMLIFLDGHPDWLAALDEHPVDKKAVCDCAVDRVKGDPKVRGLFDASRQEVEIKLSDSIYASYFSLRVVEATLSCTASELDASLKAKQFKE